MQHLCQCEKGAELSETQRRVRELHRARGCFKIKELMGIYLMQDEAPPTSPAGRAMVEVNYTSLLLLTLHADLSSELCVSNSLQSRPNYSLWSRGEAQFSFRFPRT